MKNRPSAKENFWRPAVIFSLLEGSVSLCGVSPRPGKHIRYHLI
jgi:hypothetical protein